jgi:hypothetical protein
LPELPKLVIAGIEDETMEDGNSPEQGCQRGHPRVPEARYAYYRRCQVFRRNGEQCKAPAEKGAHICYAHAGQLATAVRREQERRAVLAEAVVEMRRRGRPEFEMADLFMDFKGIQVTLAVMARALIDGRIDCKTAGQLVVHLQTLSKLLWQIHRKGREGRKDLPLVHTGDTDRKELAGGSELAANEDEGARKAVPMINSGDTRILQFEVAAFGGRSLAHGPPESKAA